MRFARSSALASVLLLAAATVAQPPINSRVLAPAHPASTAEPPTVLFIGGELTIRANNSSLIAVLQRISVVTGMKVTGHVTDGPVFGTYGPGDPQHILAALLDGTGTNILILSNPTDKPVELVLTPRVGGVTPPNPNANAAEANNDEPPMNRPGRNFGPPDQSVPQQNAPPNQAQTQNQRAPFQGQPSTDPAATQPTSASQQVVFPPIGADSTPSTATTTPEDTSTATDTNNQQKTPQQIFEQLQKLQQQRTGGSQSTQQ